MTQPKLPTDRGWMGDPRRGASLGRSDRLSVCPQVSRRFYLRRLPINSQGYDSGGAYWGIGTPLYWASCPTGSLDVFTRASNREEAKDIVREKHSGATFFR